MIGLGVHIIYMCVCELVKWGHNFYQIVATDFFLKLNSHGTGGNVSDSMWLSALSNFLLFFGYTY